MNRNELKAAIVRKGISTKKLAEYLGISPSSLYQKCAGRREFKESEIRTLIDVLALTPEAINDIFLR